MDINLKRPLLFFDIESTGLSIVGDSIVELSFVKILPGGEQRIKTWRLCPWDYVNRCQKPITPGAMKVHGITNEELANEPKFFDAATEIEQWLSDCDLAGFNSAKFDLPLLAEEFERVRFFCKKDISVDLHQKKMVDVQTIYHKMEPRNLKAAYRFYCGGQDFDNAHAAEADTLATYEVLKGQLGMYPEEQLKNDVDWLATYTENQKLVDYAGRITFNEKGEETVNFGKHKGKTCREVFNTDPSYYSWIDNGEFAFDIKRQFRLLKEQFIKERNNEKKRPLNEAELNNANAMLKERFGTLF